MISSFATVVAGGNVLIVESAILRGGSFRGESLS